MQRADIFAILEEKIRKVGDAKSKPVRMAVNGIEGTGKTTFACAFVDDLRARGLNAYHVSIDGFHFPKIIRYRQGRDSAAGYYEDSYDEEAFVKQVLLRSQSSPPAYVRAVHDLATDAVLSLQPIRIEQDAVLVTDGCYLFKPVYNDHWDFRLYLKASFETALERGANRDAAKLGGYSKSQAKFNRRYHAVSKRYIAEVNPEALADMIIDMSDFEDLKIL